MQNLVFPEYKGLFGVVTKSKIEVIIMNQQIDDGSLCYNTRKLSIFLTLIDLLLHMFPQQLLPV
jgi:hypothetical protein